MARRGQLDVWDSPTEFVAGFGVRTLTEGQEHEQPTKGRLPAAEDELLINASAAEAEQLSVGDKYSLAATEVDGAIRASRASSAKHLSSGASSSTRWSASAPMRGPPTGAVTAAGMDRLPDAAQPEEIRRCCPRVLTVIRTPSRPFRRRSPRWSSDSLLPPESSGLGFLGEQAAPQQTGPLGIVSVSGLQIATHQQFVDQQVQNATGDARICSTSPSASVASPCSSPPW